MTASPAVPPTRDDRLATISPNGLYRYSLTRRWDDGPTLGWIMLNPSTADAEQDDPTIRRCVGFARRWGFGAIMVGNVYAYRATNPAELHEALGAGIDPVGPDNDLWLVDTIRCSARVVAAWGARPRATLEFHRFLARNDALNESEHLTSLVVLGWTKNGQPKHPLYVKGDVEPQTFWQPSVLSGVAL